MPILNRYVQKTVIATVHSGAPKVGNRPGQNLDYFRVEPNCPPERLETERQIIASVLGDKPTELIFYPHSVHPDQIYSEWMEEWSSAGLKVRCDGQTIHKWLDDNHIPHRDPKPCPGDCKTCKPHGRLWMYIPELEAALGRVGYVYFETSSFNNTRNIYSMIHQIYDRLGTLDGVPLVLYRGSGEITVEGKKMQKTLVYLRPQQDYMQKTLSSSFIEDLPQLPPSQKPSLINEIVEFSNLDHDSLDYICQGNCELSADEIIEKHGIEYLIELLVENEVLFKTERVSVVKTQSGKPLLRVHIGTFWTYDAILTGRKPFIEAGLIDNNSWLEFGDYQFNRVECQFSLETGEPHLINIMRMDDIPF